jgi:hypothetical protein
MQTADIGLKTCIGRHRRLLSTTGSLLALREAGKEQNLFVQEAPREPKRWETRWGEIALLPFIFHNNNNDYNNRSQPEMLSKESSRLTPKTYSNSVS